MTGVFPVCLVGLGGHHGSAAAPCCRHSRTQLTGQLLLGPLWLNGRETGGAGRAPWCSGLVFPSDAFHFPSLARASPCPWHPCPVGQECMTCPYRVIAGRWRHHLFWKQNDHSSVNMKKDQIWQKRSKIPRSQGCSREASPSRLSVGKILVSNLGPCVSFVL